MSPTTRGPALCGEVMNDGGRDGEGPDSAATPADVRCSRCKALLAVRRPQGLLVRRGDVQAWLSGRSYALTIVCYRCKTLNVVTRDKK